MKQKVRTSTWRGKLGRLWHWFNPATRRRVAAWESAGGRDFCAEIGIGAGQVVLDFGSGPGRYSLPAAVVVGADGLVCAVDQRALRRRRLARRARALGLDHLGVVARIEEAPAVLDGRRADFILAYDVLHFLDAEDRRVLYGRFRDMLAAQGVFTVHPKHLRDDHPGGHFAELSPDDLVREIEAAGFQLREKRACTLWHDHAPVPGTVWQFVAG